jgi:hypothetical protein
MNHYHILFHRTTSLLDSIKGSVGRETFYTTLWQCITLIPKVRQPSIDYMLNNKEDVIVEDMSQVISSLQLCLADPNILVQRSSLELLATRDLGRGLELIKSALKTLLRRDTSLNRYLIQR